MSTIHSTKHSGKIALVTGGSSGLGLATAQRLVQEGASVVITGRRQAELDAAVKLIGGDVTAIRSDIAKQDDLDRVFDTIRSQHGRLDILFANAGGGEFAPLGQITEAQFDKYFGINVKGTLFTVQKALPLMPAGSAHRDQRLDGVDQGRARVRRLRGDQGCLAFVRADLGFGFEGARHPRQRGRARHHRHAGLQERAWHDRRNRSRISRRTRPASPPLGRTGTADEVAKAVSFLASDDASYITGIELFVDGGQAQI